MCAPWGMSAPRFMYAPTHTYSCLFVCLFVCLYVFMSAPKFMYAHTNKQTNNYMSAPRGMSAPRFMYAHTQTYSCLFVCLFVCLSLCLFVCLHLTLCMLTLCLLYTSPSPRDAHESRMPSSA